MSDKWIFPKEPRDFIEFTGKDSTSFTETRKKWDEQSLVYDEKLGFGSGDKFTIHPYPPDYSFNRPSYTTECTLERKINNLADDVGKDITHLQDDIKNLKELIDNFAMGVRSLNRELYDQQERCEAVIRAFGQRNQSKEGTSWVINTKKERITVNEHGEVTICKFEQ